MIEINKHAISIMVLFAILLHLWWTGLILIDPAALNATGVSSLRFHGASPGVVAAMTFFAAIFASIGIFTRQPWVVLLLLPQQVLLMMSMAGAIEAMWLGQYADGVVRPHAMIMADQGYSLFAAICHTMAIIAHALRVVR